MNNTLINLQVKCDGKQPCARCVKGSIECIFVKMTKKGPPKSYIEGVEGRLERVENSLKSIVSPVVRHIFEGTPNNDDQNDQTVESKFLNVLFFFCFVLFTVGLTRKKKNNHYSNYGISTLHHRPSQLSNR